MWNCDRRKKHWLLFLQIATLITNNVGSQEHLFQPASHNLKIQQQAVQQRGDENCETARSEIQLIKEEYDELGRLIRTCNDEVHVNKCEGFCNSQVQPSVISLTGFLKECFCCRETFLREKVLTLNHCYDPDGQRLMESTMATMEVRLKEPTECRCYKCGDFSR